MTRWNYVREKAAGRRPDEEARRSGRGGKGRKSQVAQRETAGGAESGAG